MAHQHLLPDPPPVVRVETSPARVVELPPGTGASLPAPGPEQVRTADGTFAHSGDADFVLGLLGLWTGTLLLHDLAVEHFQSAEDEEEPLPDGGPNPELPTA